MKNKIILWTIGSIMTIALPSVFAATWYVSPGGNDGNSGATWATAKKTIQAGVNAAFSNETVWVSNGTYSLTNMLMVTNKCIVKSLNGTGNTIIDCNGANTSNYSYIYLRHSTLDGFMITNGVNTASGFTVYSIGGTVQNCVITKNMLRGIYNGGNLYDCTISDCRYTSQSGRGAGVYNEGPGIVSNCLIFGNILDVSSGGSVVGGGGIFNLGQVATASVVNCTIYSNSVIMNMQSGSSVGGGGVYNYNLYGLVKNCTIFKNEVSRFPVSNTGGGGILSRYGTIEDCVISENTAHEGGGVFAGYQVIITNCVIDNNIADLGGGINSYSSHVVDCTIISNNANFAGGVYNRYESLVNNCLISYNIAGQYGGGGIGNHEGEVHNCIISKNTSHDDYSIFQGGGGVYSSQGTVQNCLITGNKGGWGGGISSYYYDLIINCTVCGNESLFSGGGIVSYDTYYPVLNSIIWNNRGGSEITEWSGSAGFSFSCGASLTNGTGNVNSDPQFYDSGRWEGTNFVGGDFRLRSYSPCINTGTNQTWMTDAVDIEGNARITHDIVDIGAYESTNAIVTRIDTPANVSASDGIFADKVEVTWSEVSGADGYLVYRNTENTVDYFSSFQVTHSPYNDTTAVPVLITITG